MKHLATRAVSEIQGWDEASVSLQRDSKAKTFGPTSKQVLELDETQYTSQEGPCLDCCIKGEEMYLSSTEETNAWPNFSAEAARQGIGSVFSVPLLVDGKSIGGLNLYSRAPDALKEGDADTIRAYAIGAAVVLANADAHFSAQDLIKQLNDALESRTVIAEAVGVLMAQERLTSKEAFEKLRIVSQTTNLKVRDIARRYVQTIEGNNDNRAT